MIFGYFGCHEKPGHYFWAPGMIHWMDAAEVVPWGWKVDGTLCPGYVGPFQRTHGREDVAAVHYRDGWTALAMWDTSVDPRPGSCSVFVAKGGFTQEEMMWLAEEHFPEVTNRLWAWHTIKLGFTAASATR